MVEDYSFGRVVIDGETYARDVIILPDRVHANWRRATGHKLCADDIGEVVAASPEVVVIGTGAAGLMKVLGDARDALEAVGAEVIVNRTGPACEAYNRLREEGRAVVAALHLTC